MNISNQVGQLIYPSNTIDMSNYKARLITLTEAKDLGCKNYSSDGSYNNTCPSWFENSYHVDGVIDTDDGVYPFWIYKGALNTITSNAHKRSYRPVITVSKSMIK